MSSHQFGLEIAVPTCIRFDRLHWRTGDDAVVISTPPGVAGLNVPLVDEGA
jgi:hypothetical protein